MQKFCLTSNKPLQEWQAGIVELLEALSDHKVRCVAVVALLDDEDSDSMTAYCDMSLRDKQMAAAIIHQDVTHQIMQNEIREALGEPDGEWEE